MVENINKVVIDASFLLNFLMPDEQTEVLVESLFSKYRRGKTKFLAPNLLKYEIYNATKSAMTSKRLSKKVAKILLDKYEEMEIEYVIVDYRSTLMVALEYGLSFYDACYLWLARSRKYQLASLDRKLVGKISIC